MAALLGPPWREVSDARAILAGDPPVITACNATAAAVPALGVLVRTGASNEARAAAHALAEASGLDAVVYRGAIQMRSGAWLWPFPQEEVLVAKAADPLTRRGFATIVERLTRTLSRSSGAASRAVLRRSLAQLRRPWPTMSPRDVDAAIGALGGAIRSVPGSAAFQAEAVASLEAVAAGVAEQSAMGAAASAGALGFTFNPTDAALARRIGRDGVAFVTDEFGRRSAAFSRAARRIISTGAADGLGPVEIGRDLATAMQAAALGRDEFYFRVVANTAAARARSFGQLRGYQAAGIPTYTWESVLDQRTCETCRFLHGQTFPVDATMTSMERALREPSPEVAVQAFPWYRVVGNMIHVQPRHAPIGPAVARIDRSAFGQADRRGTFTTIRSPRDAGGSMAPPAHGNCRCYTVPTT